MAEISAASILQMRNAILQQNSALRDAATNAANGAGGVGGIGSGAGGVGGATGGAGSVDFVDAMRGALAKVNGLQSEASAASEAFERGETTDIAAVMLAKQKASIGFETTLQVRNKLLAAYKDIMSMPV